MRELLESLFGTDGFMPHGACYLWDPVVLRLHLVSDIVTGIAYYAIPPTLVYLVVRARRELPERVAPGSARLPYDWMFLAFGVFIVACGTTHFLAAWTIWTPAYWLSGSVKALTAVASIGAALALPPLVPKALGLLREARTSLARKRELEVAHRDLELANRRLTELDRLRSRFVANVSHELRTPLTLILGPVEGLLADAELVPEDRRRLEVVRRNAEVLARQVDDLLDVARLEAGRLELQLAAVDLAALVRRTASHFEIHREGKGISLSVETPETLPAVVDEARLERVLLNLLSNAFRHTPEGGSIRCSLALARTGENGEETCVRLQVADNGPGVDPALREVVFDRFRQAEVGDRARGGTGLGLAIVRELTGLHGGRVALGDAPEGGALFTVELPYEAPDPALEVEPRALSPVSSRPPVPAPPESKEPEIREEVPSEAADDGAEDDRPRVLVVEDHPDLRRHLVEVLSREYRITAAADGVRGLALARELQPDAVVSDVMMPGMTGDEMVRRLRASPEGEEVQILLLTARADEEFRLRMLRGGVDDYLVKPAPTEELRARLARLVSVKRTRDLLRRALDSRERNVEALATEAAERKRNLERALEENRLLLHEVHHRVKGNLQTVSSMLRLQARMVDDPVARATLEESRDRLEVMARLHRELYGSPESVGVRFSSYVRMLVRNLRDFYGEASHISFELPSVEITLGPREAIPCGMIVYELVSNALRHAFPEGRPGTVRIGLRRLGEADLELSVEDDGVGIDPGVEVDEPKTFGLQLVRSFARQLRGRLRVEREDGSRFTVTFPSSAQAGGAP